MAGSAESRNRANEGEREYIRSSREDDSYTEYPTSGNQHSIKAYQQMIDEPWLDEPLRKIIETRLEDLLEG